MLKQSTVSIGGSVTPRLIKGGVLKAPLSWKIRNTLRPTFIFGTIANKVGRIFSALTGIPVITAELRAVLIKADGLRIDYGVVSRRVITTAFVNFVVDQLQAEDATIGDFKFHDSGVGTTAENVADTDIETTDGESRATGTQTEGASANIYRSVGTITYSTTKAITEHILANVATAGTAIDRSVFAAINVVALDSIQFTYDATFAAGG